MTEPKLRSVGSKPRKRIPPKPKADPILTGRALEVFEELAGPLEGSGRLNPETVHVFRLLCQTIAVAEGAGSKLQGVDHDPERADRGKTSDPTWRGFRDAAVLAQSLAQEYGLTPASAAKVRVPATPDEEARRLLA